MNPAAVDHPALTDDEIVALSLRSDTFWRAPLPTVDVDDAAQLESAALRGDRSLVARRLLVITGEDTVDLRPDLQGLLDMTLAGEVAVSVFCSTKGLEFDPTGLTYLNYRDGQAPQILTEVVAPVGIHYFGSLHPATAEKTLVALVQAVHDEGLAGVPDAAPEAPTTDTLCVALPGPSPESRIFFAVSRGSVETAVIEPARLTTADRSELGLRAVALTEFETVLADAFAG